LIWGQQIRAESGARHASGFVSLRFAKFALGVTDAKESNGAVGGGFERCDLD
jgi:hypothetical protein